MREINLNSTFAIIISIVLIIIGIVLDMFAGKVYHGGNKDHIPKQIRPIVESVVKLRNQTPLITIDDIKNTMAYIPRFGAKPGSHIGQRKLFLTEVQYLTEVLNSIDQKEYVVYAGAAPSNKGDYLVKLFPNVTFIMVDPSKFDININGTSHIQAKPPHIVYLQASHGSKDVGVKKSDWIDYIKDNKDKVRIFLIEDYMTDDFAKMFAPLNAHFISDIRSNILGDEGTPSDLDVIWNVAMQYTWIKFMQPKSSMLKFRTPYFDADVLTPTDIEQPALDVAKTMGIDFVTDFAAKKFIYFDGKVNIQAWPGRSSSETRLISYPPFALKAYDYKTFEDKMFYYNVIDRGFVHRKNDYASKEIGFDHCNDCAIEATIWEAYKTKFAPDLDIIGAVKHLSFIVKRSLFIGVHGYLYDINLKYVDDIFKQLEEEKNMQHKQWSKK